MRLSRTGALLATVVLTAGLSGCATAEPAPAVAVVTTTNVWADITKSIAPADLEVQPILSNANQDPHSYEASVRDQLLVSKAKLVIAACNSSDSFIKQLAKTQTNLLCLETNFEPTKNPHLWYDVSETYEAAQSIRTALAKLEPNSEAEITSNFEKFNSGFDSLNAYLDNPGDDISALIKNRSFTAIEPVASALLQRIGLTDLTPASVKQAAINEVDLSPSQLEELKAATAKAGLFAFNSSQPSAQSEAIQKWLKSESGLPKAVGFSEQLPDKLHYFEWMLANAKATYSALTGKVIQ